MTTLREIAKFTGPDGTIKVYRDSEYQEYRVRMMWCKPETSYHTDDKDDAMSTARYLAGLPVNMDLAS